MPELHSVLPITTCKLPAIHVGTWYRIVKTTDQMKLIRENALPPIGEPQYFWDSNNVWYKAVNLKIARKAPWLLRFCSADDLRIMEFELQVLPNCPLDMKAIFRDLSSRIDFDQKKSNSEAKKLLKAVTTSSELMAWMSNFCGVQKY